MTDLSAFAELVPLDHGLSVISTLNREGNIHSAVVNAGVLPHPLAGTDVVGLVAVGGTHKLGHLRAVPRATVLVRAGWRWAAVEGPVELIGPDDPHPQIDREALRRLLQDIFRAAGGAHDDWGTYDKAMVDERRTAVLLAPRRAYGS